MSDELTNLPEEKSLARLSRRDFLRGLTLFVAGSALSACGAPPSELQTEPSAWNTATPPRVLQSPQPPATVEATATTPTTPAPGALGLEAFLALSAVLTGVENLNPVLGQVYLQALQTSTDFDTTPAELYEQAGFTGATPPDSADALSDRGIFDQESTRNLADKIIEYWYTGICDTSGGEQAVATFVDALAWKTLNFTKPPTICGSPGFWEKPPWEPIS